MKLKDLGSMMANEDLTVHILNNLTKDYEVQLSKLEEKLGSTTTVLTIDTVRSELQLRYACMTIKKNAKQIEDAESEKALVAFRKFKGTCTFCSKIRHKATSIKGGGGFSRIGFPGCQKKL